MTCEVCQQENATVHLTQIVSGKMRKIGFCAACAKEQGASDPAGFSDAYISAQPSVPPPSL